MLSHVLLARLACRPDVSVFLQGISENTGLFYRLYQSFGILRTVGFKGHKFPILVGEIGSDFDPSTCCDLQFMSDALKWLTQPNAGTYHVPIRVRTACRIEPDACMFEQAPGTLPEPRLKSPDVLICIHTQPGDLNAVRLILSYEN